MAIQFMRQQKKFNPWLMSVNIFQPHHPFWPTQDYLDRYDPDKIPSPAYQEGELDNKPVFQRVDHQAAYGGTGVSFAKTDDLTHRKITAAYYAMIEQVDTEVGRMLKVLEETGQADNTIVIYMSDHGEMLGDHGIYLKGPYFYDCMMRVPLMIRWPGKYKAGLRSDALGGDGGPRAHIARSCRDSRAFGVQGPFIDTGAHRASDKAPRFRVLRTLRLFVSLRSAADGRICAHRTHKLSYYHNLDAGELYDLQKDPGEVENLWTSSGAKGARAELTELLLGRMVEAVDPLPERKSTW